MVENMLLRDAVSWAAHRMLAEEASEYARRWKPETLPDRIEELCRTRERYDRSRQLAIAAGQLAPGAQIHIRRHSDLVSTGPLTGA